MRRYEGRQGLGRRPENSGGERREPSQSPEGGRRAAASSAAAASVAAARLFECRLFVAAPFSRLLLCHRARRARAHAPARRRAERRPNPAPPAPRRSLQHSQVAPASRSQLRAIEYENSGSSIEDEEKCGSWEKSVFLRGGPGVTAPTTEPGVSGDGECSLASTQRQPHRNPHVTAAL